MFINFGANVWSFGQNYIILKIEKYAFQERAFLGRGEAGVISRKNNSTY
jgi:hypothetical protein